MSGWTEFVAVGLARTTLVSSVAALAAFGMLRALRVRSPKIHRLTWLLVIVQGWLLIGVTWRVEVTRPAPVPVAAEKAAIPVFSTPPGNAAVVDTAPGIGGSRVAAALLIGWALGGVGLLMGTAIRRLPLLALARLGEEPDRPEWESEWRRARDGVRLRRRVELRLTRDLGPLACWTPGLLLVLTPRALWEQLTSQDRLAILRHELAHCERGDLWKNLVVRLLALPQWFNPLIGFAVRRFEEAGEWACDEHAARASGQQTTEYASTLLRVAGFATRVPSGATGATGGELTRRVKRLIHLPDKEDREMKSYLLPALLIAIAVLQTIRVERVEAEEAVVASDASSPQTEEPKPSEDLWNFDAPYVVEPPDILLIRAVKLIPKANHTITSSDGLLIQAKNVDAMTPIANVYSVSPQGEIDLGPKYGKVDLDGATLDAAREKIRRHLARKHPKADLSVSFAHLSEAQSITGEHLIHPDGRINFGKYGSVFVSGFTLVEAQKQVEAKLSESFEKPKVTVDVFSYNSKACYLVTRAAEGDSVIQMPVTGNETVMDAIATVGGIRAGKTKVWIERPARDGLGEQQTLPIDLPGLFSGDTETNYRLYPGDQLIVVHPGTDAAPKASSGASSSPYQ